MIERKNKLNARIGVFGVVHGVYFDQFEGLREKLEKYHNDFIKILKKENVEVIDFGLIENSEQAYEVSHKINGDGIDVLMCNMVTYATSSVFAPLVRDCNIPMVLVVLQPRKAMDYAKASTFMQLENDNICAVPEFTGVAARLGKKIRDVIIGTLYDDADAEKEIAKWCNIAKVMHSLNGARIGLMGHTMEAMYDMHTDPTAVSAAFGIHVPMLEIDDVIEVYNTVTEEEIQAKIKVIDEEFDMPEPKSDPVTSKLTDADKYQAAKSAVALDKFVEKYNLTGLAYYY